MSDDRDLVHPDDYIKLLVERDRLAGELEQAKKDIEYNSNEYHNWAEDLKDAIIFYKEQLAQVEKERDFARRDFKNILGDLNNQTAQLAAMREALKEVAENWGSGPFTSESKNIIALVRRALETPPSVYEERLKVLIEALEWYDRVISDEVVASKALKKWRDEK
jgi:chromosome segregation ATPase